MTDCIYGERICWETFDQCEECETCEFNPKNNRFSPHSGDDSKPVIKGEEHETLL